MNHLLFIYRFRSGLEKDKPLLHRHILKTKCLRKTKFPNHFFLSIFLVLIFSGKSGSQVLELHGFDNFDNEHIVTFGFDNDYTIGIDSFLNEQNIIGVQPNDYELRIQQNDKDNFDCLYRSYQHTDSIFLLPVFHSMVNIRSTENILEDFLYFEFRVYGENWNSFSLFEKNLEDLDLILDKIIIAYGDCSDVVLEYPVLMDSITDLYIINLFPFDPVSSKSIYSITIKFRNTITTNEVQIKRPGKNYRLFPNPSHDIVFVQGIKHRIDYCIYDLNGKIIKKGETDGEIKVEELPSSLYVIKLIDKNKISTNKFYKK